MNLVHIRKFFQSKLKSLRKFDGYLLLFEENKFVVLHVFFCIRFLVASQLVQVQTVFIATSLSIQKELAKFTRAETCSDHTFIQYKLVN